jgi:hypothetical protein
MGLLIPEFLFRRHRKEFPLGLEGVKGLAEVFQTSLTAMGIRYATLCTEPVAVVVSEGSGFCTPFSRSRSCRNSAGAPKGGAELGGYRRTVSRGG